MPSKLCPNCFKEISTNIIPNFCCWCGTSLKKEKVLFEYKTYEEKVPYIEERKNMIEVEPGKFQMRLF